MRAAILLLSTLAVGTAVAAPAAHACNGDARPLAGGTYASGAPHGYREAPSVPISALPTLPPTRGYSSPATGYYAPGPAVGVHPLPRPQPSIVRSPYVRRPYYRPYRRVIVYR
jgi:hypothetical protein